MAHIFRNIALNKYWLASCCQNEISLLFSAPERKYRLDCGCQKRFSMSLYSLVWILLVCANHRSKKFRQKVRFITSLTRTRLVFSTTTVQWSFARTWWKAKATHIWIFGNAEPSVLTADIVESSHWWWSASANVSEKFPNSSVTEKDNQFLLRPLNFLQKGLT